MKFNLYANFVTLTVQILLKEPRLELLFVRSEVRKRLCASLPKS